MRYASPPWSSAVLQSSTARPIGLIFSYPCEYDRFSAALEPPLVVKVLDADIAHKSELGAVRVGLEDAGEAERAALEMQERLGGTRRFLIEEMVSAGLKL